MSVNLTKTPLGKFNFAFLVEDDPKVEGARKRGCGLFIPKTPEGYVELTTDPEKQKKYAAAATAWAKAFKADCEEKAKAEFGAKWKTANWCRITDGDELEDYPGYWKVQAKSKFKPGMADRTGKPVAEEDAAAVFANGNWGIVMMDETKAGNWGGKKCLTCGNLQGIQHLKDGEAPAFSGGSSVTFAALPELEEQAGDFAPLDDGLDNLE